MMSVKVLSSKLIREYIVFILHFFCLPKRNEAKKKAPRMFFLTADWLRFMANFYKLASLRHIEILTPKSCDLPKKHNGESNEQKVGKPVSMDSFYFYHNTLGHSQIL